jgi:hypothetical protein
VELTYIGIIAAVLGVVLLLCRRRALFGFVIFCSLFGAAAAVNLSALGNASIPPGYFALAFLIFGVSWAPNTGAHLRTACRLGGPFLVFAGWAAIGAFALPRLFEGAIDLPPMKFKGDESLFFAVPLAPSPRNVTQAVYIVGTCAAMVMATIAARSRAGAWEAIVRVVLICGLLHAGFGVLQLGLDAAGQGALIALVRNGNYGQVDQMTGEFHRIAGLFNETSSFSCYGFFYLVFAAELWMRRIQPRLAGLTALTLASVLLFTTSTSAYVGLAAFALVLIGRIIVTPHLLANRLPAIAAFGVILLAGMLLLVLLTPGFVDALTGAITAQTVGKAGSASAVQRTYWARKGFEAFAMSDGLGVGVGSFRSSSFIAAIVGSTGVIGVGAFLLFAARMLRPAASETWDVSWRDGRLQAGIAAGWAAVLGLAPSLVASASADPGLIFGIFAGLTLAWRSERRSSRARSHAHGVLTWRNWPTWRMRGRAEVA